MQKLACNHITAWQNIRLQPKSKREKRANTGPISIKGSKIQKSTVINASKKEHR